MKTIARVAPLVALALAAGLVLPSAAAAQGNFFTLTTPCRVFDSRQPADAPALAHNTPRLIQITGPECGVDGNASSVAVNITVAQGTTDGDVVLYAGDAPAPAPPRPGALPFKAGKTRSKVDIVALGDAEPDGDGDINALATMDGGTGESVHLILDIFGYFVDDEAPVAEDDTAEVDEDDPATTIDVLANDTDPDGGTMLINAVQNPSTQGGTVLITNAGADLTYEPAADYCNTPPGTTLDTFTYTLNGGDTATVTVTVNCVDDLPTAVDDTATVAEDSGANAIDVLANDTDPDGGTKLVTAAGPMSAFGGTIVITGGGTGLTYEPAANYCNNPPGTTLDTFSYTITGGDTATVTVTVTCVDDFGTAEDDTATVAEDSGANTINVLANDIDPDGGSVITLVQNPSTQGGTVLITNAGADLTYQPAAGYCNDPPGTTLDTFTYTITGGDTATVTVTVTCFDNPPVAVDDTATVGEDSGANAIDVLANDTDTDGGPKLVTAAGPTSAFGGAVVITGGGTGLTYAPAENYCNDPPGTTLDTFSYTITGGDTATVTVTVTCVNDGPAIDLDANDDKGTGGSDFAVTFTEGDAAKLIEDPADATITDPDSTTLVSLTVTLTNLLDTGDEVLDADVSAYPDITKTYDDTTNPAEGVLTLSTVTAQPIADFQAVLRTVTYINTDEGPDATARVVEFVANDGTSDGNTAVSTVTVTPVDDNPTAVDDAATVNEDSGANAIDVLANDTDPDGGTKLVTAAGPTSAFGGTIVITGGGTGLTYAPAANYCNDPPGTTLDTFTYTVTGGDTATVTVTVTCVDDNPTAVDDAATVDEDSGANAIDVLANDTDPDGGTKLVTAAGPTSAFGGAIVITGGGTGLTYAPALNYCNNPPGTTLDTFSYTITGGDTATVTVTVTCIEDDPTAVDDAATVNEDSGANAIDVLANDTDPDGGTKLVTAAGPTSAFGGAIVITGGGTGLTYAPAANYCNNPPGTTLDTFSYTVTGGDTGTVTVTVTCIDDPPVAVADAATVNEDSGANAIDVLANDTDIDGGPKLITSAGPTSANGGTIVITGGGTGLTYAPALNYCNNPPGSSLDTFSYTITGGSNTTVTVTVTCINDAPVAGADAWTTIGNTELRVNLGDVSRPYLADPLPANGVLNNDNDPVELTAITLTGIPGCDVSGPTFGPCATTNGGTVTLEDTGVFTYTPAAGSTAADSFVYRITDAEGGTGDGTVTLTISNMVWYVDPDAAGGGTGTSIAPFNSLTGTNVADTSSGDNDTTDDLDAATHYIYIDDGTLSTTQTLELEANQHLIGEGEALSFALALNGNLSPAVLETAGTEPVHTNTSGNAVAITTAIPVEIIGLSLQGTGNAIDLTTAAALSGSSTLTIGNNTFRGATAEGIDVNLNASTTGTLTLAIQDNAWTGLVAAHGGNAVDISRVAGTLNVAFNNNTNILSTGTAVLISGGAVANTTVTGFSGNTILGDTTMRGVDISNATFDANTVTGGFQQVDGNALPIGTSGNPVGGSGMVLTTVQGNLLFDDLTIFAGLAGLQITGTGSGMTFAVTPAGNNTVDADGGPAVDMTSVTLNLQLDDLDSTTSTSGVSLSSVGGTFSAATGSSITKSSGGGTAFSVASSVSGTSVSYAGTLNVTSGAGVSLTSNTGSTISFSGGMTLSTGANTGFAATGGGTINVTDPGAGANTIVTTTATALNVANTTIGSSGLTFESISVDGNDSLPTNGIIVNTTGSTAGLTVTGTGSANSGGTIQDTSGDAILLTSTQKTSLSWMNLTSNLGSGVRGTTLNGFVLQDSSVTNNGNQASPDESGVELIDLTGTSSGGTHPTKIEDTTISNNFEFQVQVTNASGVLTDFQFNNNTVSSTGASGTIGNLVNFLGSGSATMTLNAVGGSYTGNAPATATAVNADTGGGSLTANVSGASFTNNNVAVTVSTALDGDLTFDIHDNPTVTGNRSHGLNLFIADGTTGAISGKFRNNLIGTNGVAGSGSSLGFGIRVQNEAIRAATIEIDGNTVRELTNFAAINVNHGIVGSDFSETMNVTITDNIIDDVENSRAIIVQQNVGQGTTCANIARNDMSDIAGNVGDGTKIRIRQLAGGTFNVTQKQATGVADSAELDDANSPPFVTNTTTVAQISAGGSFNYNSAACPLP
jgi:predicted RNA-binding protein with EMAP domain